MLWTQGLHLALSDKASQRGHGTCTLCFRDISGYVKLSLPITPQVVSTQVSYVTELS